MLRKDGKPDALDKLITLVKNKILNLIGKQSMSGQDTIATNAGTEVDYVDNRSNIDTPVKPETTHTPDGSIKLGSMVRDAFTGYTGIAMVRERRLTGSVLICVEKRSEVPDDSDAALLRRERVKFFDECRLEVINEDLCKYSSPLDECTIPLGAEVEDKVLKVRGIATRLLEQVNGCVHVFVEYSEHSKETGIAQSMNFHEDHKRFKIIGAGVSPVDIPEVEGPAAAVHTRDTVESRPTGCCVDDLYS